jgi:hypothetical protein
VLLTLDPNGVNVKLISWYLGSAPFRIVSNPGCHISFESDGRDIEEDITNRTVMVHFRVLFNWTWPHEDPCDVMVDTIWGFWCASYYYERLFSVENDLDLHGPISARGEWQGALEEGDWVRAGENVTVSGPRVVYEGTTDIHPPAGVCNVTLTDDDGNFVSQPSHGSEPVGLTIKAEGETDLDELLTLSLSDLPGNATLVSEQSFYLKVDGDPPSFRDAQWDYWHNLSRVRISTSAEDLNTSGIDASTFEYSYTTTGPSGYGDWTSEDVNIMHASSSVEAFAFIDLPDGKDNHVRWRVKDLVGNSAMSEELQIELFTKNITYSDPVPDPDAWNNASQIECGVTISDIRGHDIDMGTIQYRISDLDTSFTGPWTDWEDEYLIDTGALIVRVTLMLNDSDFQHLQWRVMDPIAGLYVTSTRYRVMVDTTPPEFLSISPGPNERKKDTLVWVKVEVRDLLADIDPSRVWYRYWTTTPAGQWERLEMSELLLDTSNDKVMNKWLGETLLHLDRGPDNMVQFRAWDLAGNEAISDMVSIWVNRQPVPLIASPREDMVYSSTAPIPLSANGSIDPDGDALSFEWYFSGSLVPFTEGEEASVDLGPGTTNITLRVIDEYGGEAYVEVQVTVLRSRQPRVVWNEGLLLVILIVIVILIITTLATVLHIRLKMGQNTESPLVDETVMFQDRPKE